MSDEQGERKAVLVAQSAETGLKMLDTVRSESKDGPDALMAYLALLDDSQVIELYVNLMALSKAGMQASLLALVAGDVLSQRGVQLVGSEGFQTREAAMAKLAERGESASYVSPDDGAVLPRTQEG